MTSNCCKVCRISQVQRHSRSNISSVVIGSIYKNVSFNCILYYKYNYLSKYLDEDKFKECLRLLLTNCFL